LENGFDVVSWQRNVDGMPVTYETWLVLLSIVMAIRELMWA